MPGCAIGAIAGELLCMLATPPDIGRAAAEDEDSVEKDFTPTDRETLATC